MPRIIIRGDKGTSMKDLAEAAARISSQLSKVVVDEKAKQEGSDTEPESSKQEEK